jgi:hemin uptake protein HemP
VNTKIASPTQNDSAGPRPPELPARVSSESLLGSRGELLIVHNGREYRLRLTQNGKLILTA